MGMGHASYKTMDPREKFLKEMASVLGQQTCQTKLVELTMQIEETALAEFAKRDKQDIKPNVDFYSSSVYHMVGITTNLMTPFFAISRMLMESLAVGREISLPSTSTGGSKFALFVASAYSDARYQFGIPIGAIDNGEKTAVANAIMKYQSTEKYRNNIIDAMDILGGAAISLGPKNILARSISVYLPRLRGHGTDPEALKHVSADDWELDFERAFTTMRQICNTVFIGGFSTGGLLALLHAAQYKVDGVIAINSALKLNNLQVSYVVPTLQAFNEMISHLHAKGIKEWVDNDTENPTINYTRHPLASIAQLEKVMTRADKSLNKITDPIFVLQGDSDPVVNPKSAQLIYNKVRSPLKKLVVVPRDNHITITGKGHTEIFESIHLFIEDVLRRNQPSAREEAVQ